MWPLSLASGIPYIYVDVSFLIRELSLGSGCLCLLLIRRAEAFDFSLDPGCLLVLDFWGWGLSMLASDPWPRPRAPCGRSPRALPVYRGTLLG